MNLVTVDFNNHQIEIVEETQSVVISDICEALGIDSSSQKRKLQSDESYESKLIKVQTRGGLQEVFTIPLSKLNGWLFSINPNKVKPEVKQKLIEYKKECFNVLNNYFTHGIAINNRFNIHQISGYKSQIAQHNKKIALLENRVQELSTKNESLKIQNIKLYKESKDNESFVNKIKNLLGVSELKLKASEHNALLEIIYQMKSFSCDVEELINVLKIRKEVVGNNIKVFTSNYNKCEEYANGLENKKLGALQSKYRY